MCFFVGAVDFNAAPVHFDHVVCQFAFGFQATKPITWSNEKNIAGELQNLKVQELLVCPKIRRATQVARKTQLPPKERTKVLVFLWVCL